MVWTGFIVVLVTWLILMVSRYTLNGAIHILFVAAILIGLIQILWRRRSI